MAAVVMDWEAAERGRMLEDAASLQDATPKKCGLANAIFLGFATCHLGLFIALLSLQFPSSAGYTVLIVVSAALFWDNAIIGSGSALFGDAASNPKTMRLLVLVSQPRFLFHAGCTPLLSITFQEIGTRSGVGWLQGDLARRSTVGVAAAVAAASLVHHLLHPRLVLKQPHRNAPPSALCRDLTSMTIAELSEPEVPKGRKVAAALFMILPAVLTCIWAIVVGVACACVGEQRAIQAGTAIWVTALLELLSNAGPPWTMVFTGNAGEVVLLGGCVAALVYVHTP